MELAWQAMLGACDDGLTHEAPYANLQNEDFSQDLERDCTLDPRDCRRETPA